MQAVKGMVHAACSKSFLPVCIKRKTVSIQEDIIVLFSSFLSQPSSPFLLRVCSVQERGKRKEEDKEVCVACSR